jgi:hypothetical protein
MKNYTPLSPNSDDESETKAEAFKSSLRPRDMKKLIFLFLAIASTAPRGRPVVRAE